MGGSNVGVLCAGGGDMSSEVQDELVNVTKIYTSVKAFAALRSDGTVRTWGDVCQGCPQRMLAPHAIVPGSRVDAVLTCMWC